MEQDPYHYAVMRRALDLTFFPELYDVRARVQDVTPEGYHGGDGA